MENLTEDQQHKFDQIYFDEIGMCGCGRPEEVKKFIFDLLKNHREEKLKMEEDNSHENIFAISKEYERNRKEIILKTDPEIIFEFVFHVLDKAEIVNHGGSVYGSWLTDKGEEFFNLLAKSTQ